MRALAPFERTLLGKVYWKTRLDPAWSASPAFAGLCREGTTLLLPIDALPKSANERAGGDYKGNVVAGDKSQTAN